jgi:hypothetical protein
MLSKSDQHNDGIEPGNQKERNREFPFFIG